MLFRSQAIVLAVREQDESLNRNYTTGSTVLSSSFVLSDGVALHVVGEQDYDAVHELQFRVIGVLDLAFFPEQ